MKLSNISKPISNKISRSISHKVYATPTGINSSTVIPPIIGGILLETGDSLLLETGDSILLES